MPERSKRPSRRGRRGSTKRPLPQHTSHPTGRYAYAETRRWLLGQHGPICAYCGVKGNARAMTLDHVTPRRGQSAYDRRDNLVLACKRCNGLKADKPFLQYLLAHRSRAGNLLRYGGHLSQGILDIVRHMAGDAAPPPAARPRVVYGRDDDDESPYSDSPYRMSA